jgi:uncharacterized NAD(P)/FAD-binding protein YdhS
VSRQGYGRYIRDTLNQAIAAGRPQVLLDIIEGTVVDLERADGGFSVRLANGEHYRATAAALCTGNGRSDFPFRPESVTPAARDFMIRRPFADHRIGTIEPDARVLLIGTGLTMVDQVLTLDRAGHGGQSSRSRATVCFRRVIFRREPSRSRPIFRLVI